MGKTRRVTITELARITGRSESTWRKWLREPNIGISVELGGYRGGSRERRGQTRLIDLDAALRLHEARGGDVTHEEFLPEQSLARMEAEIAGLRRRLTELEEIVRVGGVVPPIIANERHRRMRPSVSARPVAALTRAEGPSEAPAPPVASDDHDDDNEPPAPPDASYEPFDTSDYPADYPVRAGVPTRHLARPHRLYSQKPLLPLGLVALTSFMQEHGARESQNSTFRKAQRVGRLPVRTGDWLQRGEHTVPVTNALDQRGRRRAWELWRATPWFQSCPYCPHTAERERGASYTPSASSASASEGQPLVDTSDASTLQYG